jgi:hypothetical protein
LVARLDRVLTSALGRVLARAGSGGPVSQPADGARPLVLTGALAAAAAAGTGLAILTLLAAIGWVAAPHAGSGLTAVLRAAGAIWLVGHHVGFTLRGAGRIGLLPLGLVLLPGALLWRAGRWVVSSGGVLRLRHVGYAAVALAVPYALIAGALALAATSSLAAPSPEQAVVAGFLLALTAGGLGAARQLAPWRNLAGLLPVRARSVILGCTGSLAVLLVAGCLLAGASLAAHLPEFRSVNDALAPGLVGAILLLLAQVAYVPNAAIWGVAFMLGPGFAFGSGTVVAPTGAALGPLPAFPLLAALPSPGTPPAWLAGLVALPVVAAVLGVVVMQRRHPVLGYDVGAARGLGSGVLAGLLVTAAVALAGGSVGPGRMADVGAPLLDTAIAATVSMGVGGLVAGVAVTWWARRR